MSFHLTSKNITIKVGEKGVVLCADCADQNGQYKPSEINLDEHIGNKNAHWFIGGKDFCLGSHDFKLTKVPLADARGDHRNTFLTGLARHSDGEYRWARIDLAAFIANEGGRLVFRPGQTGTIYDTYKQRGFFTDAMSRLGVEWHNKSGELIQHTIELNDYIGLEDGKLVYGGKGFCDRNRLWLVNIRPWGILSVMEVAPEPFTPVEGLENTFRPKLLMSLTVDIADAIAEATSDEMWRMYRNNECRILGMMRDFEDGV